MYGLTTKETAEKWGVTPRQVQLLCASGRIPGALRFGHAWVIPFDAEKPQDRRKRNNNKDVERNRNDNK